VAFPLVVGACVDVGVDVCATSAAALLSDVASSAPIAVMMTARPRAH